MRFDQEIDFHGFTFEVVGVVTGSSPQTHDHPGDDAEIEIFKVYLGKLDITDHLEDSIKEELKESLYEKLEL